MNKHTKCLIACALTCVVMLGQTVPATAMDPPPPPGGGGGAGAAGQEFATYEEVRSHSGIRVEEGAATAFGISGLTAPSDSDFSGKLELREGGEITASGISGLKLEGDSRTNGVAINLNSESDVFTIGGEEPAYQENGKSYNTVISVDAENGNEEAGYEAVYGVGVAINTGELRIVNSLIRTEGPRSTPIYAFSTSSPGATSLVVKNSRLEAHSDMVWMPPFKLLAGGARASLLMTRNHSWFYGSEVIANNWGAISQDSVDAMTYVVNSSGTATEGGYGTYLTYGMRLYGSELYGGQYGVFMCGTSDILSDKGGAALDDDDAMSKSPDYSVEDRESVIAAPFNAVVVHNSLPDITMVAKGEFRHTLLSTDPEDLPDCVAPMAADDPFFMPGVDIIGSGNGCGASYFFNRNLYGSLALIRSMNADFVFDDAETKTTNGVLVQSVVTYDPPSASGYLTPELGTMVPGISVAFRNGSYEGDILHQDYQRGMKVTVGEDATLSGAVVSGTYAGWNALWQEENLVDALAADGYTPDVFDNNAWVDDVQANLIRPEDTIYAETENLGVSMTVEKGGTWIVTGDCSLGELTIEDGGTLTTPEGCMLQFYVNCNAANALEYYDESGLEPTVALDAGTYDNVVIRLSGTPAAPVEELSAQEMENAEQEISVAVEDAPQTSESAELVASEPASVETTTSTESADGIPMVPIAIGGILLVAAAGIVAVVLKRKK